MTDPLPDDQTVHTPSAGHLPDDVTRARAPAAGTAVFDGPPAVAGYELADEIARGGMGVVHRARDASLDREVAVKVMRPGMSAAEFVRESRITARLPHPGIPPVHALGTLADGRPFLAMKLIKGDTLDHLLRASAADRTRFVAAFEQICQAVGYAHAQGIIHRDLKPANVMVGAFGEVQVMDWGLAKEVRAAGRGPRVEAPDAEGGTPVLPFDAQPALRGPQFFDATVAGQVKGTPAYMPPEQARGEPVDARADVFALGGILAAILTGHAPFGGTSVIDTIRRAAQADLSDTFARLDASGADADLVALAKRCLAAHPADRPADGTAVMEAVAAYRAGVDARLRRAEQDAAAAEARAAEEQNTRREAEAREREQRKKRRAQLALAGVVAAALAGAGIATAYIIKQRGEDKLAAEQQMAAGRLAAEQKLAEQRLAAEQQRQADLKAADDAARAKQRQTRADALVQALATADTAGVPRVVLELTDVRDLARPELLAMAGRPVGSKPGLHARLALADDPRRAAELAAYLLGCRPDELLTVCEALVPHAAAVVPGLWAALLDPKADGPRRVRAGCAVARLAPFDPRWKDVAPAVAEAAVRAGAAEFVVWAQALEPAGWALVPPLLARYPQARGRIESGRLAVSELAAEVSGYDLTAALLARYTRDRPADLAELAILADPRHYAQFAPALRANRDAVVPLLEAEARKGAAADWKDPPLRPEWAAVPPDAAKAVEAGQGVLHERFAFVQAVPLAGFEPLAETLRASGYRPRRVRPYAAGGKVLVAAVWLRDNLGWKLATGLTADELRARDAELRRDGFAPVEVAAWVAPDVAPPAGPLVAAAGGAGGVAAAREPALRFAAVWTAAPGVAGRLILTLPHARYLAEVNAANTAGLTPVAIHAVQVPGEALPRYSGVWATTRADWSISWGMPAAAYHAGGAGKPPVDVSVTRGDGRGAEFAGVWHAGPADVEQPTGLSVAAQLAWAKGLAADGWRPVAVGVAGPDLTASVWYRPPVVDADLEAAARRRGHAAAALAALGEGGAAWALLAFPKDGDPTARSHLTQRLAQVGADPSALVTRFDAEPDVSARRALLVALGDFPPDAVPGRAAFAQKLLALYRDHPDPGLHGAIDWLLRQKWGAAAELAAVDAELAREARGRVAARAVAGAAVPAGPLEGLVGPLLPAPAVARGKDWFVNGEGQTFAVVRGPAEFAMGSPRSEPDRSAGDDELRCPRRVPRAFAVATKEVTIEQFLRFRPGHKWDRRYSPGPDTPAVSMTWYEAAEYCNWLSAREGIPVDQWCYEPSRDGQYGPGMRVKAGHLARTGYRLPTEAEWEFACRAGSTTARYHGRGEELRPRYAWFAKSGGERAWPVGLLRPNDLGLFDVLCNVNEWCGNIGYSYAAAPHDDVDNASVMVIDRQADLMFRGGGFIGQPVYSRSAARMHGHPGESDHALGFRPARTLP